MIDSNLLKEAIADAKAVRQTKLATCACGHCSASFKSEPITEEEIDRVIDELEKELTND